MLDCHAREIDAAAMRLMLLRHAKSEKAEPGQQDRARHLNARGRGDAARMGTYMAQHGLVPDRVLVSPALRTRETWECVGPSLAKLPPVDYEERLYEGRPDLVLAAIKEVEGSASSLLVVGHNPSLQGTAAALIGTGDVEARERLDEGLPTGGLIVIDFAGLDWPGLHVRSGRLERFVTPASLKAATD
jgi:phosphohistidine phosphatase